jgi:single-stranded DNA-binding protein
VGWFAVGTCVLFRELTTFTVASNEFLGGGNEKSEYHPVVAWQHLTEFPAAAIGHGARFR